MRRCPEGACWRTGGRRYLPGHRWPRMPGPGQQTIRRLVGRVFVFSERRLSWCFSKRSDGSKRGETEDGACTFSDLIQASRFPFKHPFDGSAPLLNSELLTQGPRALVASAGVPGVLSAAGTASAGRPPPPCDAGNSDLGALCQEWIQ